MAKLLVEIDDALLARVLIDSQDQEISLDAFICEALGATLACPAVTARRKVVDVDELIAKAIKQAYLQKVGSEFLLVDLCSGEDWESLSGGERKSLGKGFRKAVESQTPRIAEFVRRTSSNKAVYRRV